MYIIKLIGWQNTSVWLRLESYEARRVIAISMLARACGDIREAIRKQSQTRLVR
jgi:hypothetical protein